MIQNRLIKLLARNFLSRSFLFPLLNSFLVILCLFTEPFEFLRCQKLSQLGGEVGSNLDNVASNIPVSFLLEIGMAGGLGFSLRLFSFLLFLGFFEILANLFDLLV